MKCSMEELYDEIYVLREKVKNYEQRDRLAVEK
jgi:hypothetical protein